MGYKIDSDILFDLIHSELKTFLSSLSLLIPDDNKRRHFEMAIGGIIKKAGELTDAGASKKGDMISRQQAIELAMQYCPDDDGTCSKADEDIRNLLDELEGLPSVQPEYRPVNAEDFSKTMSENTVFSFWEWHGKALELMENEGFVICKRTM